MTAPSRMSSDSPTWVLAATTGEMRALARVLPGAQGSRLHRVGMGPDLAGAATAALLDRERPRAVLLAGLAGGLAPDLRIGDVVVAASHEPAPDSHLGEGLPVDSSLTRHLQAVLERLGIRFRTGTFVTSPKVISEPAEKLSLGASGSLAVEMEGLAVARACSARGVPFASLRVVLDPAHDRLPDLSDALDASGEVSRARLMGCLIRRPRLVIEVPGLIRTGRHAHRVLASVVARLAPDLEAVPG